MKRFIILVLCYLLITNALFAFAEDYVPSPDLKTITARLEPHLTLVNKDHKLPDNWLDLITLVPATNSLGEELLVEENTLAHFQTLREELLLEGIQIELDSAYRSLEEQQAIWDEWLADPELGSEYCEQYLARVGYSEHHTGFAIDIFIVRPDGTIERDNEEMLADRDTFAKIHAKLASHGFILRYPEGKEDITGYAYEPWHFRYVGEEVATYIYEHDITFEEFCATFT